MSKTEWRIFGPDARNIERSYPDLITTLKTLGLKPKQQIYVGWKEIGIIHVSVPELMKAWYIPTDLLGNEDIKSIIKPIRYTIQKFGSTTEKKTHTDVEEINYGID